MNIKINIEEYLSPEEIKDIIKEEVKVYVRQRIGTEKSVFVSKLLKDLVRDEIQIVIPNFEQLLNDHIKAQIETFNLGDLFWKSFGWRSEGNRLMNKVLAEHEDLIAAKVKQIFT